MKSNALLALKADGSLVEPMSVASFLEATESVTYNANEGGDISWILGLESQVSQASKSRSAAKLLAPSVVRLV